MRTEEEIFKMILAFARADDKIRAVLLVGSRANPAAPKDIYQEHFGFRYNQGEEEGMMAYLGMFKLGF